MRMAFGYARLRSRGHLSLRGSVPPYAEQSPTTSPQEALDGGGGAVQLALGGTLFPGFVLAAELTSHMITSPELRYGGQQVDNFYSDDAGIKYTTVGLLLAFYPVATEGFNAGLAFGTIGSYSEYYDYSGTSDSGWFLAPQLGYEWWAADQWSVGALCRATFARMSGDTESDYIYGYSFDHTTNVALLSFSLTVTLH